MRFRSDVFMNLSAICCRTAQQTRTQRRTCTHYAPSPKSLQHERHSAVKSSIKLYFSTLLR